MKFKVVNPEGFGKTAEQKVKDSFNHYEENYTIISGERAAYGNPEYIIIKTDQDINSEVMQSIAYNTKVEQIFMMPNLIFIS